MWYSFDALGRCPSGRSRSRCASHLYTAVLSSLEGIRWISDVILFGPILVLLKVWLWINMSFLNHVTTRCFTGATLLIIHVRLWFSNKFMTPFEPVVESKSMLSGNAAEGRTEVIGLCCSHCLFFWTNKRKTYCIGQALRSLRTDHSHSSSCSTRAVLPSLSNSPLSRWAGWYSPNLCLLFLPPSLFPEISLCSPALCSWWRPDLHISIRSGTRSAGENSYSHLQSEKNVVCNRLDFWCFLKLNWLCWIRSLFLTKYKKFCDQTNDRYLSSSFTFVGVQCIHSIPTFCLQFSCSLLVEILTFTHSPKTHTSLNEKLQTQILTVRYFPYCCPCDSWKSSYLCRTSDIFQKMNRQQCTNP